MPQLDIVENFADNTILTQAQLHSAFLSVEDFVNLTKLDEENIQAGTITSASIATGSLTTANYGISSITLSKLAQEILDKLVPSGSIQAFGGVAVPSGWLYCDGSAVSRTIFSSLFSAIGIRWGFGDGSTSFNLPDLRGRFLRGHNDATGRDPDAGSRTAIQAGGAIGDNVGSLQADEFLLHNHGGGDHTHTITSGAVYVLNFTASGTSAANNGNRATGPSGIIIADNGGTETRPKNVNVKYIIKI